MVQGDSFANENQFISLNFLKTIKLFYVERKSCINPLNMPLMN